MRLIDADALKRHYSWWKGGTRTMTMDEAKADFDVIIDLQPTIEAVPLEDYRSMEQTVYKLTQALAEAEPKHGRWLIGVGENGKPIGTYCSECGWSWERNIAAIQLNKVLSRIETPRCPYCGARMDAPEDPEP